MKKVLLLLFLSFLTLSLSSCKEGLSIVETRVREFDYYTEIVDFDAEHGENIKLVVAYNEDSTEVTYIYYIENVQNDMEFLVKIDNEIIYEDFIVREYSLNKDFMGEFTGSSLELSEDSTLVNMRLIPAGFSNAEHVTFSYFYQEFNIIKSTAHINELHRNIVSTENYLNRDIQITEDNIQENRNMFAFFITLGVGAMFYISGLGIYKSLYSKALNRKLENPEISLKFPDLQVFKYISAVTILVLIIASNIILSSLISKNYDKVDFYSKYAVNYEQITSDTVNLEFGGTYQFDQNVAFIEKGTTHNIMGFLYIELDDGLVAVVPEPDYGGYNYRVTYRFIQSDYMDVTVKEWNETTNEPYLEDVLHRILYFDVHR